ncbi:uncharacterized protein [Setaria viridis]|uniref:uncharacterized protein n=1 Tax=Setaria viridis TaxID=4556 RepID=UPI003B3A84F8
MSATTMTSRKKMITAPSWYSILMIYLIRWTLGEPGLDRNPNGTIIASDKWWKTHTKKRLECRKLRLGIPAYIDFLREMFHGVTVDGRPSCIPGEASLPLPVDANADEDDEYADGNANGNFDSPMSTSSRRRASSTIDIASSPPRKNKSP